MASSEVFKRILELYNQESKTSGVYDEKEKLIVFQ